MPKVAKSPSKTRRAPNQLSPAKEQGILDAALAVFIERGVGGATMDQVAERAGVTKVTVYRRFQNKFELFEKVIEDASIGFAEAIIKLPLDINEPCRSLRRAAEIIQQSNAVEKHVEAMRLIVAETRRHPEACARAVALSVISPRKKLEEFFRQLVRSHRMQCDNPAGAAKTFVMVFSRGLRPMLNAIETEERERQQFETDLSLFFRGFSIDDCDDESKT